MANLEVLVIDWLKTIVDPAYTVSGDKPNPMSDTYITVDRTGGPREAMVLDRASILIEVYNKDSRLAASDVANMIADRIPELPAYDQNITHADVNSLVNLDDVVAEYHRYQLYCDVYYRR